MFQIIKKKTVKDGHTYVNYSITYSTSIGKNYLLLPYSKDISQRSRITETIAADLIARGLAELVEVNDK